MFGALGSGLGVSGFGFRISGFGFRISGFVFRAEGSLEGGPHLAEVAGRFRTCAQRCAAVRCDQGVCTLGVLFPLFVVRSREREEITS